MKSSSKNRGFTLIELMVVISIVSLLASVILATTATARRTAQKSALEQSLIQFQLALEVYKSTYDHYPYENGPTIDGLSKLYLSIFNKAKSFTPTSDYFTSYFQTISPNGTYEGSMIPSIINQPPLPLKNQSSANSSNYISYYIASDNYLNGKYCGSKPVKGYLLELLISSVGDTYNLPDENTTGIPTGGLNYQWCLTAP